MISYLVMASYPGKKTRRLKVHGILPSSVIAKGYREAGWAVVVLKPLERKL